MCARHVDLQQRREEAAVLGDHGTDERARPVYQLKWVDNLFPKVVELVEHAVDRANRAPDGVEQSAPMTLLISGHDRVAAAMTAGMPS